ncbi:hypothetical protein OGATHE_004710 [Ogataea polymorpha]|uniref:Uncharacterized protein n=1 Tax=Ogataea polymorpha TaxID=460523 RepID=A0A9P8P1U7_9ASCO|nr:hypothetical protein OGATHE_004710 [Ogataea polymorpha]
MLKMLSKDATRSLTDTLSIEGWSLSSKITNDPSSMCNASDPLLETSGLLPLVFEASSNNATRSAGRIGYSFKSFGWSSFGRWP